MKRILALLLALFMTAPLAACSSGSGDKQQPTGDTAPGGASQTSAPDTEPAETEPPFDPGDVDELPADLDFGGAAVRMTKLGLTREEDSSDRYESAVYERQLAVSERLNVKLEEVSGGNWVNTIRAQDDAYQLCSTRCVYIYEYSAEGLAYLWTDLDYLDFTKNYWFDFINDNLTIGGKLCTAVGAYNITSYDYTHVILFNKRLLADYTLEDPYELVRSGAWTWDKFTEFGRRGTYDVDGDGLMSAEDAWGFYAGGKELPQQLLISAGFTIISKDEDDIPYFDLDMNEPFISMYDRMLKMMYGEGFWKNWNDGDISETGLRNFQEDRGLMIDVTFSAISSLRDMDADFGVLPYPKYTQDQENYLSRIEDISLSMIPITCTVEEANRMAAVLEALSSYGIRYTVPEYYEVRLKTKYARDQESGEMFDLIMANRVFDLGVAIAKKPEQVLREIFLSNRQSKLVSSLSGQAGAIEEAMDTIIYGFEDNLHSIR